MALDTEIFSIEDLMEFYSDTPENVYHYKIFCTDPAKEICFGVGSSDDELLKDLKRIARNTQNRNKYFLVLYTDDSFKKASIYKSVSFQLNKKEKYIAGLQDDINELRNESNDDDDDDDEKESGIIGYIKQMFPPQVMQQLILQMVSNFTQSKNNQAMQQSQAIGSINENDGSEAVMILQNLINKGVTIDHLRKLDAIDVNKLHTLLMML